MKNKRTLISTFTGIAVLLGAVLTVPVTRNALLGATYNVPKNYTTISAAVNAMPSTGGTILVSSGSYPLVEVAKSNVRIECIGVCVSNGFNLYSSNNSVVNFDVVGAKQAGIYIFGTGHLVEGNDISGTTGDGDGIRAFGSGHIIRGNYIHDPLPALGAHIDCLQTWDESNATYVSLSNFVFEDNTCSLFGSITAGMQLEGNVNNGVIRNNVITSLAGIRGYLESGNGVRAPHDLTIEHNIFIGGMSYSASLAPVGVTFSGASNIVLKDNIILNQPLYTFRITGSNNLAYNNLAYNSSGAMPPEPNMPLVNSMWGVNPNLTNDYRPMAGSPVIGSASDGGDIGLIAKSVVTPITVTVTPTQTITPSLTLTITGTKTVTPSQTPTQTPIIRAPTPTPTPTWKDYRCLFSANSFMCEIIP